MAILRKGEPTIKTRLFTALSTGEVKVDALSDPGQMRELARRFECSPATVKRYLQEWKAQRAVKKKKHTGYKNPERVSALTLILDALETNDWEWLECQVATDLLELLFPDLTADEARERMRENGW